MAQKIGVNKATVSRLLRGETLSEAPAYALAYALAELSRVPIQRDWDVFDTELQRLLDAAIESVQASPDASTASHPPRGDDVASHLLAHTLTFDGNRGWSESESLQEVFQFVAQGHPVRHELQLLSHEKNQLAVPGKPPALFTAAPAVTPLYCLFSDGVSFMMSDIPRFNRGLILVFPTGQYFLAEVRNWIHQHWDQHGARQMTFIEVLDRSPQALSELANAARATPGTTELTRLFQAALKLRAQQPDRFGLAMMEEWRGL
ncbi:hypothetical protein [Streptomyces sp. NPDC056053]|uniref:hypothetical protein n=1 Tax=Streptomyces sp. NPDC056053 TaxID=3345696 RepID=UPI0035E0BBC1